MSSWRKRLVNFGLWLLLVVVPAGYCLHYIAADFYQFADLALGSRFPGHTATITPPELWEAAQLSLIHVYAPRTLTALLGCTALLLPVAILTSRRHKKLVFVSASSSSLAKQLLGVLLLAYLLGSLAHFGMQQFHLMGLDLLFSAYANYYCPLQLTPPLQGWTIYPPLSVPFPMLPDTNAACIKLGALFAVLTARYVWLRRQGTLQPHVSLQQS